MRIERKLNVIMLLAVLLGMALAVVFLLAQRWEATVYERKEVISEIADRAFSLALLGQEIYLHPRASRAVEQWLKTDDELRQLLQGADLQGAEELAILQRLSDARRRLAALFGQLRELTVPAAPLQSSLIEEQRERLNDQMSFTVQTITADVLYLQRHFRKETNVRRREINRIVAALAAFLTAGIALLAYVTGSSITRPLLQLRRGTAIVGGGDLSYRVGTEAQDEIGELSRDFDAMLARLQQVTASREQLTREVERRLRTEEALRKSEESLKMAQAIAHLGHWEWDVTSGALKWSDETYRILGYQPHALEPSYDLFMEAIHPDDRAAVDAYLKGTLEGKGFETEYRILLADGSQRTVHARGEILHAEAGREPKVIGTIQELEELGPMEILGVIQDITERKELEAKLQQEAHTDALTGCANRRYILELCAHEVGRARRYGHELALLMLDLDHFKNINDRYGHSVGDRTLKMLVQVCRAALREEDLIGRLGGEEFAVLLPETGEARALEVAERLREAVAAAEVPVNGESIHFTTSVGVTTLRSEDRDIEMLLNRADRALYAAKQAGRNRVCSV